jgi:hypothetical protein
MHKLYCYVDEAGQHTEGALFVVSVVITEGDAERQRLASLLEAIEQTSGKRRQKWRSARHEERLAYLAAVLGHPDFTGKLSYALYRSSRAYVALTIKTVALAIQQCAKGPYKATILVDGLRHEERNAFAVSLRHQGIRTEKVRGADDKKDPFIRLADALCGFIVDATERVASYRLLFNRAQATGVIRELEE